MARHAPRFMPSGLRQFMGSEASGGLVLMASAALALVVANSSLSPAYLAMLRLTIGGLSLVDWVNDALMAVFFLLVGLEIKREVLHSQLRSWRARALPGVAALGGMIVPAALYALVNAGTPTLRGWAIPAATDIAFALGVAALLGRAVPASLKVLLTAIAVIDDLGAVVIIAIVYTDAVSLPLLGLAAVAFAGLIALNRMKVRRLAPYLVLGALLWVAVLLSGVHATIAGVLLAFTIPATGAGAQGGRREAPLHRLESALDPWVAFVILPIFGFANAGVPLAQVGWATATEPVALGVALGLVLGKQAGVFGSIWLAVWLRIARRPAGATWAQIHGMSLLCGIGFTMSLFIGLLAFARIPESQDDAKIGILAGSVLSAIAAALVLRLAPRPGRVDARPSSK